MRQSSPSGTRRGPSGAYAAPAIAGIRGLSARQQDRVDHVNDAVRLVHVTDGDLSGAALGIPNPDLAVLLGEGEVGTLDGLEHGLAISGPDLFRQVLRAQTPWHDV